MTALFLIVGAPDSTETTDRACFAQRGTTLINNGKRHCLAGGKLIMQGTKRDTEILFGLHLVHSGHISSDQFVEALSRQFNSRPKLGTLACQNGKLSMERVFRILKQQTETGAPFGAIAVELGYLTRQRVTSLLQKQNEQTRSLINCLRDLDAVNESTLEQALDEFRLIGPNLGNVDPDEIPTTTYSESDHQREPSLA